jgi:hypothetical protein
MIDPRDSLIDNLAKNRLTYTLRVGVVISLTTNLIQAFLTRMLYAGKG